MPIADKIKQSLSNVKIAKKKQSNSHSTPHFNFFGKAILMGSKLKAWQNCSEYDGRNVMLLEGRSFH